MPGRYTRNYCAVCRSAFHLTANCPTTGGDGHLGTAEEPGPRQPASAAIKAGAPTVRTTVPVEDLLTDILALSAVELQRLKTKSASGNFNPHDAKCLESLIGTVARAHELDRKVREDLRDEFGARTDAELRAMRDGLGKDE